MKLGTDFWKKYFRVYDTLNHVIPYQELLDSVVKKLDLKKGELVLEVGSGTGNLSLKIERCGAILTGIDYSEEAISLHKKKSLSSEIILGDITQPLPFSENQFDKICSNNVIYALDPGIRIAVLRELRRVLKPGGIIAISNLNEGFKAYKIYLSHIRADIRHNGLFSALYKCVKLIYPTILIFYYNYLIKKEHRSGNYGFMKQDEQVSLLSEAGFVSISETETAYAGQAVINSAKKQ
jgi:ubiquinone/menaquinone biosynthesis C-methylase UbiE